MARPFRLPATTRMGQPRPRGPPRPPPPEGLPPKGLPPEGLAPNGLLPNGLPSPRGPPGQSPDRSPKRSLGRASERPPAPPGRPKGLSPGLPPGRPPLGGPRRSSMNWSARGSRGLNGRRGRSSLPAPSPSPGRARGLKLLECSNFGLALAQPSFLAGLPNSAPSSAAVSAARTRLGLRDGSDMAEPDLPRTIGVPVRRPGVGAGVS